MFTAAVKLNVIDPLGCIVIPPIAVLFPGGVNRYIEKVAAAVGTAPRTVPTDPVRFIGNDMFMTIGTFTIAFAAGFPGNTNTIGKFRSDAGSCA